MQQGHFKAGDGTQIDATSKSENISSKQTGIQPVCLEGEDPSLPLYILSRVSCSPGYCYVDEDDLLILLPPIP